MTISKLITVVLLCLIWGGMMLLQVLLMSIARFFERTAKRRTRYPLYLLPIILTAVGASIHLLNTSGLGRRIDLISDPVSNVLLFAAGLLLVALGNDLYEKMMGGSSHDQS